MKPGGRATKTTMKECVNENLSLLMLTLTLYNMHISFRL